MKSHKNITRRDVLKHSGSIVAGFTLLPHSVLAAFKASPQGDPLSVDKLASYQIVVPDQASAVEQQAAERLQHYLAEASRKNLVIKKEADYRSDPAFFIGQTQYARTRDVNFKQLREDGFAYYPDTFGRRVLADSGR